MTKLEDIEKAISGLSPEEYDAFRKWFIEFQEELFDRQIERDVKAGKLDKYAKEAIADLRAGRVRDL